MFLILNLTILFQIFSLLRPVHFASHQQQTHTHRAKKFYEYRYTTFLFAKYYDNIFVLFSVT